MCYELSVGSSAEWHDLPAWRMALRKVSFRVLLPFYVLLRLTIPLVDPGTYSQQWLVVAMLCWWEAWVVTGACLPVQQP